MQDAFPNVQLFGCLFLLVWNMKKQLSEAGLATCYKNNREFALQARMIIVLALVPLEALDNGLEALEDIDPELVPVRTWFELNYVDDGRLGEYRSRARSSLHLG